MISIFITALMFFFSSIVFGQLPLDDILKIEIKNNGLAALERVTPAPREVSRLGAMLFHETQLSGNKNIACNSCHHPMFGTADAMPFSIGTGGTGMGGRRRQNTGGLTKRHSPHLMNLGYPEIEHMFWDGRVHYNPKTKILTTPEPGLNGAQPKYKEIASVLTSSLAAQTIFPIVNDLEMRGGKGNDIADAGNNYNSWKAVMNRLLKTGPSTERYQEQFKKAFPKAKNYNIGHVGEALGKFLGTSFNVIDTPYDRYLKGDLSALKESEKRGLLVFTTRGKCVKCHNGKHLSNFEFKTVATPQLTPEGYPAPYDQGRYEVTGVKSDLFKFRTPNLRNISLTAPFMHNGAFKTLDAVIEHYNDPEVSLNNYSLDQADLNAYSDNFVIDRDKLRNKLRVNLISIGEVRRGIKLTEQEKQDLLAFLETGLLDYRFQRNR
ncbi:MAG: hypothetical protein NXH75_14610 [Halobacteriovoraceae bacterium]|nr:hypothetical protein [Halobacteriovoraceae bacterium]